LTALDFGAIEGECDLRVFIALAAGFHSGDVAQELRSFGNFGAVGCLDGGVCLDDDAIAGLRGFGVEIANQCFIQKMQLSIASANPSTAPGAVRCRVHLVGQ